MTATLTPVDAPTERSAPLPWPAIVRFAAIASLCMTAYVLLHVAQSSSNPLDFIQPGSDGPSVEVIRADFPDDELPAGVGLDGQQYYAVARDPFHVRDNADHLDRPRYRMQRPVYPMLAWSLHPIGGGTGLIVAFVIVGIAALFVGCVATGALSTALRGPPWAAVLFAATPGAFWSLRVSVADTLALALAISALAFASRNHSRRAVACAILAVLTKEVALLLLVGWLLANRSRRVAVMAGSALAAVAGWAVLLRIVLPADPAGVNEFGAPFVGLVRAASRHWIDHQELWGCASAVSALALAAIALGWHRLRHPLSGIIVVLVAFASIMNSNVIGLNFGATRSMMGLFVIAALCLVTPDAATRRAVVKATTRTRPADIAGLPATTFAQWSRGAVPHVRLYHVVLLVLAAQFVTIALFEARRDSATVDEAVDVASGITIVVRQDFRMNPEHGPLPKVLSALPALLAHPIVPDDDTYRSGAWFDYTDRFIAENRAAGRLDDVLFLARTVAIAEGLAVALLLYRFGRRFAGPWGGTVSAALWLTTPVFIGFSHFAMIDIAFTLALLLVSLSLLRLFDDPSPATSAWCGVACSGALLTRHNALPIVAAVVIAVAVATRRDRTTVARNVAIVGLVSFALVWAFYRGIDPSPPEGEIAQRFDSIVATAQDDSPVARAALAVPLPDEFRAGLGYLFVTSDERPAYAFGHSWDGARLWFFPAAALAKLSLVTIACCVGGLIAMRRIPRETRRLPLFALWVPAGTLGLVLLAQPLNLGLRYAFPLVAALFACAAPVALFGRPVAAEVRGGVRAALQIAFVWVAVPHSLAWTPPPFTPAYRYVTDSNVDYGQDVERFIDWSAGREVTAAIVRARGFDLPATVRPLVGAAPATVQGWVAVSVTNLTALHRDELAWLRAYCPVDSIGGSILLYYFDETPTTADAPAMPAAMCRGAAASHRA